VRQTPHASEWPSGKEPVDETDAFAAASSLRDPSGARHGEAPHQRGGPGRSSSPGSGSDAPEVHA
jgi:hypothetical protein